MILRFTLAWTDPLTFVRWDSLLDALGLTASVLMLLSGIHIFIRFRQ